MNSVSRSHEAEVHWAAGVPLRAREMEICGIQSFPSTIVPGDNRGMN